MSSPESCAVSDKDSLAAGGNNVIDTLPLLEENLALKDTDPLIIVQGQIGFFGALLGSKGLMEQKEAICKQKVRTANRVAKSGSEK